jgi:hypothetical protein
MEQGERSGTFLHEAPQPGPEHARLEVFIGKWINEAAPMGVSAIWTSVAWRSSDAASGKYTSHFFDSQGHVTVDELTCDDGKWIWSGERTHTTSEFSEDGELQRSLHEQSEDGVEWRPAIDVTLR